MDHLGHLQLVFLENSGVERSAQPLACGNRIDKEQDNSYCPVLVEIFSLPPAWSFACIKGQESLRFLRMKSIDREAAYDLFTLFSSQAISRVAQGKACKRFSEMG